MSVFIYITYNFYNFLANRSLHVRWRREFFIALSCETWLLCSEVISFAVIADVVAKKIYIYT